MKTEAEIKDAIEKISAGLLIHENKDDNDFAAAVGAKDALRWVIDSPTPTALSKLVDRANRHLTQAVRNEG